VSNFVRAGHQLPGCPALASYGTAACSPTNLALSWRASAFRLSLDSGCLARRPGRFRGRRTGPPEVLGQVAPGGRLVIPLRVRGSISRSVAFERDGDGPAWRSVSHEMAMFVPLRKPASRWPTTAPSQWRDGTSRTSTGTPWPLSSTRPAPRSLAHAREAPRVHPTLQLGRHGRPRRLTYSSDLTRVIIAGAVSAPLLTLWFTRTWTMRPVAGSCVGESPVSVTDWYVCDLCKPIP